MGYLFMCVSLSHSNWGGNIVEHFSKADGEMNYDQNSITPGTVQVN